MSVDATGKILYTAGADACIKSWNIATGQMLKVGQGIIGGLLFKAGCIVLIMGREFCKFKTCSKKV